MTEKKTVIVYVDGFALYKGLLQKRYPDCKWLDLVRLSELLFQRYEVIQVRYFTAKIRPFSSDPSAPQRQAVYLRALETLPKVSIHYGTYMIHKQWLVLHLEQKGEDGRLKTAHVRRPEEKGSDVALASYLMFDAMSERADLYAVVTNDSDLVPPLCLLSRELGKNVALVSVVGEKFNKAFRQVPLSTIREIRHGALKESQLPQYVQDSDGRVICKP